MVTMASDLCKQFSYISTKPSVVWCILGLAAVVSADNVYDEYADKKVMPAWKWRPPMFFQVRRQPKSNDVSYYLTKSEPLERNIVGYSNMHRWFQWLSNLYRLETNNYIPKQYNDITEGPWTQNQSTSHKHTDVRQVLETGAEQDLDLGAWLQKQLTLHKHTDVRQGFETGADQDLDFEAQKAHRADAAEDNTTRFSLVEQRVGDTCAGDYMLSGWDNYTLIYQYQVDADDRMSLNESDALVYFVWEPVPFSFFETNIQWCTLDLRTCEPQPECSCLENNKVQFTLRAQLNLNRSLVELQTKHRTLDSRLAPVVKAECDTEASLSVVYKSQQFKCGSGYLLEGKENYSLVVKVTPDSPGYLRGSRISVVFQWKLGDEYKTCEVRFHKRCLNVPLADKPCFCLRHMAKLQLLANRRLDGTRLVVRVMRRDIYVDYKDMVLPSVRARCGANDSSGDNQISGQLGGANRPEPLIFAVLAVAVIACAIGRRQL